MRRKDVSFWLSALSVLWASVLMGTSAASTRQNDAQASLSVTWLDPAEVFPSGAQRVGQHVKGTFEYIDVSISWEVGSTATSKDPKVLGLRVLLTPSDPTTWGLSPRVMGLVPKQEPREAIYIFFPAILRALGYSPEGDLTRDPRVQRWVRCHWRKVSLAISRVAVHEIVHVVVPTRDHRSKGLMRSRLSEAALVRYRPAFDARLANAFRMGLAARTSKTLVADAAQTRGPSAVGRGRGPLPCLRERGEP